MDQNSVYLFYKIGKKQPIPEGQTLQDFLPLDDPSKPFLEFTLKSEEQIPFEVLFEEKCENFKMSPSSNIYAALKHVLKQNHFKGYSKKTYESSELALYKIQAADSIS